MQRSVQSGTSASNHFILGTEKITKNGNNHKRYCGEKTLLVNKKASTDKKQSFTVSAFRKRHISQPYNPEKVTSDKALTRGTLSRYGLNKNRIVVQIESILEFRVRLSSKK